MKETSGALESFGRAGGGTSGVRSNTSPRLGFLVVKRRYPLEAVSRIRAHETTLRAREKAEMTEKRRDAERNLADTVEKKEAEQRRLRTARESEVTRLGAGHTRAGDLAQAERFRTAAARRIDEREDAERRAASAVTDADAKESSAASALMAARAAEKSISEHRARFQSNERRAADHREEEATEDSVRSRRGQRGHRGG